MVYPFVKESLMGRAENIQLNVRSAFARDRVHALSKLTGMTASEVVEDAGLFNADYSPL